MARRPPPRASAPLTPLRDALTTAAPTTADRRTTTATTTATTVTTTTRRRPVTAHGTRTRPTGGRVPAPPSRSPRRGPAGRAARARRRDPPTPGGTGSPSARAPRTGAPTPATATRAGC